MPAFETCAELAQALCCGAFAVRGSFQEKAMRSCPKNIFLATACFLALGIASILVQRADASFQGIGYRVPQINLPQPSTQWPSYPVGQPMGISPFGVSGCCGQPI